MPGQERGLESVHGAANALEMQVSSGSVDPKDRPTPCSDSGKFARIGLSFDMRAAVAK